MKSFRVILTTALLTAWTVSGLSAQTTALGALQGYFRSAPEVSIPAASAPVPYKGLTPDSSLSGEALFAYLHSATEVQFKAEPSYKASKAYMYSKADNGGCNGAPGLITFYSQVCVNGSSSNGDDYKEKGDQNGDGIVDGFINAEHIWPQGYFKSALPMVADLHHLMPTFVTPNGRRGNYKFAMVSNPTYSTSSGSKLGKEGFEPANAVKGNVARAMLYFVTRYSDKNIRQGMDYASFWTKNVPMLLQWNRQDPPDAAEKRRNDMIEQFQGNRNPFVDNPSLADRIGEKVFQAH